MAISTTYSIRPATEEDLPAILNLYGEAGLDGGHRMDLERARDMLARFADYPDYRLFVVADTVGKPIATYALLIMDNVAHNGQPIAIVEQIAVNRSHQRQGLGTYMMQHAMREARVKGCYKLGLSSHTDYEHAHTFYDKLGFSRHGYSFYVKIS